MSCCWAGSEAGQLRLFDLPATIQNPEAESDILEEFESRLVVAGRQPTTAGNNRRTLAAMVRQAGVPSIETLIRRIDPLIESLTDPSASADTRQVRHLAIDHFLSLMPDYLPEGTAAAVHGAYDARLPARTRRRDHLVDRELKGSTRQIRRRPPFTLEILDQALVDLADGSPWRSRRMDLALLAIHVRSGLPTTATVALRWETVIPLFGADEEFQWHAVEVRRRMSRIVFHREAIAYIHRYWRAKGEPNVGPLFPFSAKNAGLRLNKTLRRAGLPGGDARWLRSPFGQWLVDRGWDELIVTRAFGLQAVHSLQRQLEPVRQAALQRQAAELLSVQTLDGSAGVAVIPTLVGSARGSRDRA